MNSKERRAPILKQMEQLSNDDINCFQCTGLCCTYTSNSMQITPLETIELLGYLKDEGRWSEQLKSILKECITTYRLDKEISTGKNTTFRRTYTCPFFTPGPKGCSIAPEFKPYGCLAFNPKSRSANGENCHSDLAILEKREKINEGHEKQLNDQLRDKYQLWWEKQPIPIALLDIDNKISSS